MNRSASAVIRSFRALIGLSFIAAAGSTAGCVAGSAAPPEEQAEGIATAENVSIAEERLQGDPGVCNLVITTNIRELDMNQRWRGGAAMHQGYVAAPTIHPYAGCGPAGILQTMNDGQGYCAYPGETILNVDSVDCHVAPPEPVCNLVITTNLREIDANSDWLGGAADRGGYTDDVALIPTGPGDRCYRDGFNHRIRTMNDGEGFCAYNGEVIEHVEVERCDTPPLHPVCDLKITASRPGQTRVYDVDMKQPTGEAAHGGYVYSPAIIPTVMDGDNRCTKTEGYGQIVRTFADGEGFCAYDHEEITSVERTLCPFPPPEDVCNLVITTDRRTVNVNTLVPGGRAAYGGFVTTPTLADASADCHHPPQYDYDQMFVVFGDGHGFCAYQDEVILSVYREPCAH